MFSFLKFECSEQFSKGLYRASVYRNKHCMQTATLKVLKMKQPPINLELFVYIVKIVT